MNENDISHAVIWAAIELQREVGPGLVEKPYEEAMCHELHLRGLAFLRKKNPVPFAYKGVADAPPEPPDFRSRSPRLCASAFK